MKVQLFEILLDDASENPHAVYKSGQTLNFRVHLNLLKPVKCRAIYVKLFGSAYVHWTETKTRGGNSYTKHYRSEEIYMDQKVALYTPDMSGPNAEHHPAGEFYYPVSFQLPPTAPSSFEGGTGRIRYFVKANIDRPWKFDNYTQKFYTVIRDLDLNTKPVELTGPFSTSNDFDVNCCICFNCCFGKVSVNVALEKKAFVPGEEVHVTGEIRNTSSTALEKVSLEIYQRCVFHAKGKTHTYTRVASDTQLPGVAKGETMRLDHRIPVSALPSSHIEGCNNIEVLYFLRLNADGGCCLSMTEECCELLIGTVPLWSSLPPYSGFGGPGFGYKGPMADSAGGDDVAGARTFQPPSGMLPPPPSYEECSFGRVAMDKEEGRNVSGQQDTQWAPSYPVYALATAPPPHSPIN